MTPNSEPAWRRALIKADEHRQKRYKEGAEDGREDFDRLSAEFDSLDPKARKRRLKEMMRERKELARKIRKTDKEHRSVINELARLYVMQEAMDALGGWFAKDPILEKPTSTLFHILREDALMDRLLNLTEIKRRDPGGLWDEVLFAEAELFVVEHNWATAFAGATDFEAGDFRLPFDVCAFEMRITGMPVIAIAAQDDDQVYILPIVGVDSGWVLGAHYKYGASGEWSALGADAEQQKKAEHIAKFIGNQIRAISISLDAEVAAHEMIRAPHKLNAAREKRGQLPIYDYHVVALSHRHASERTVGAGTGTRKRLHFRRGHWRHYATFKTWIRWCLVGNPELGFIDKEYRL